MDRLEKVHQRPLQSSVSLTLPYHVSPYNSKGLQASVPLTSSLRHESPYEKNQHRLWYNKREKGGHCDRLHPFRTNNLRPVGEPIAWSIPPVKRPLASVQLHPFQNAPVANDAFSTHQDTVVQHELRPPPRSPAYFVPAPLRTMHRPARPVLVQIERCTSDSEKSCGLMTIEPPAVTTLSTSHHSMHHLGTICHSPLIDETPTCHYEVPSLLETQIVHTSPAPLPECHDNTQTASTAMLPTLLQCMQDTDSILIWQRDDPCNELDQAHHRETSVKRGILNVPGDSLIHNEVVTEDEFFKPSNHSASTDVALEAFSPRVVKQCDVYSARRLSENSGVLVTSDMFFIPSTHDGRQQPQAQARACHLSHDAIQQATNIDDGTAGGTWDHCEPFHRSISETSPHSSLTGFQARSARYRSSSSSTITWQHADTISLVNDEAQNGVATMLSPACPPPLISPWNLDGSPIKSKDATTMTVMTQLRSQRHCQKSGLEVLAITSQKKKQFLARCRYSGVEYHSAAAPQDNQEIYGQRPANVIKLLRQERREERQKAAAQEKRLSELEKQLQEIMRSNDKLKDELLVSRRELQNTQQWTDALKIERAHASQELEVQRFAFLTVSENWEKDQQNTLRLLQLLDAQSQELLKQETTSLREKFQKQKEKIEHDAIQDLDALRNENDNLKQQLRSAENEREEIKKKLSEVLSRQEKDGTFHNSDEEPQCSTRIPFIKNDIATFPCRGFAGDADHAYKLFRTLSCQAIRCELMYRGNMTQNTTSHSVAIQAGNQRSPQQGQLATFQRVKAAEWGLTLMPNTSSQNDPTSNYNILDDDAQPEPDCICSWQGTPATSHNKATEAQDISFSSIQELSRQHQSNVCNTSSMSEWLNYEVSAEYEDAFAERNNMSEEQLWDRAWNRKFYPHISIMPQKTICMESDTDRYCATSRTLQITIINSDENVANGSSSNSADVPPVDVIPERNPFPQASPRSLSDFVNHSEVYCKASLATLKLKSDDSTVISRNQSKIAQARRYTRSSGIHSSAVREPKLTTDISHASHGSLGAHLPQHNATRSSRFRPGPSQSDGCTVSATGKGRVSKAKGGEGIPKHDSEKKSRLRRCSSTSVNRSPDHITRYGSGGFTTFDRPTTASMARCEETRRRLFNTWRDETHTSGEAARNSTQRYRRGSSHSTVLYLTTTPAESTPH